MTAGLRTPRVGQPPWIGALQLSALWSLAVLQPLLQVLAPNATFFLFHRATWVDAALVALALSVPAFALFWLIEWAAARVSPRLALGCRLALVAALGALIWVQPLKRLESLDRGWVQPLAWFLALAGAALYLRAAAVRRWLALFSGATPIFLALFLLSPEVRGLAATSRADRPPPAGLGADSPDVVVVVLDALPLATLFDRDLGIDRDLFPNFARLADTAHWFRNASTPASMTNLALPAILTGNPATGLGAATLIRYPDNLFTLLDAVYRPTIVESVTRLAPRAATELEHGGGPRVLGPIFADLAIVYRHLVTVDPVAAGLPTVEENWGGFAQLGLRPPRPLTVEEEAPEDGRGRQFEAFVASIRRREQPQLYFLHTLLTHKPSRYLPSGRRYKVLVPTEERLGMWWIDAERVAPRNYLRHVLQIQYADALLGRMIDRLREEGLWDGAIVVVCADHGQTFWPRGGTRLDLAAVVHPDDVLRVPLFIKEPGQASGTVDDRNVDLRDVTPAIASLLGIELPWATEGRSPLSPDFPERPSKRIIDEKGAEVVVDGAFAPDRDTLTLLAGYTSPQESWRRLYRTGPLPELVGRKTDEFETAGRGFSFALDEAEELADLDPRRQTWPVRLSGTVDFPGAPPKAVLALALNGRIETTLQLRFRDGRSLFSGFVAEEAIVGGRNAVELLMVDADSGEVWRGREAVGGVQSATPLRPPI